MHVRCSVASVSHTIADDCFRLFTTGATSIKLTKISARSFVIDIDTTPFEDAGSQHPREVPFTRELTALDVENAAIVFRMIVNDTSLAARTEYVKGLLHMGASYNDINFHREAFGNFYRCLENCATRKILQVRHLTSEVKQLQAALATVGADDLLLQALREVYAVRSSQVAHAQQDPVEVTFDDVLKVKCLVDLMLPKTYRRLAEELRSATASAA